MKVSKGFHLLYDDGIPLVKPICCGREGQAPILIKLPSLREEQRQ
ncbi:hypothetical protein [Rhodoferax sp.]|nr:hypothetical protein [Rhodoferax sp.]MDO8320166.1 hypothetical protein [Rhodoferax sp.]